MSLWVRVFAALDTVPDPDGVDRYLAAQGQVVRCAFAADSSGWYRAELHAGASAPVVIERFLADEEGIRAELNAWAGHLEALGDSPLHHTLMERIIQARQLFTIEQPDEIAAGLCEALSRYLASATDGFFQVDEQGFFAADGRLLVAQG
jgi:hypothetical protein